MYVIIGATGNTGKGITLGLLRAGKEVRIISRDAIKAKELITKGAELFLGNSDDVVLLEKAFKGATAVYAMLPMIMQAEDVSASRLKYVNAITEALKATHVKNVVGLSSVGADLESNSGVVLDLHKMEQSFNQIKHCNVLHLRPSYFMENTLMTIDMIKEMNVMPVVLKGDIPIPAVAVKDISKYAIKRLLALDFTGKSVQYLLGERDVTYPEIASVFGKTIGKPNLQHVQVSYADFKQALLQMEASQSLADSLSEFFEAVNNGLINFPDRNAENTQATSIEEFADTTFKFVYNRNH